MIRWQIKENAHVLARLLAQDVSVKLQEAIATRGKASLVVSGGSTPRPFFEALNKIPLSWEKVWVTLADERLVDRNSPDSNERLVRETLLAGKKAHFVELEDISAILPPYDVVVLGMGEDGHTASLFPHSDMTSEARCITITPPPYATHRRITQTFSSLLDSRWIALHVTGEKKLAVLKEAEKSGDCHTLPVRAILHQSSVPVDIYYAP
jgi:6-phosphogluconolactonase